jgi:hypothetical protein
MRFRPERTVVGTAAAVRATPAPTGLRHAVGEGQDALYIEFFKLAGVTLDPNERELLAQLLRMAVVRIDVDRAVEEERPRPGGPACLESPSRLARRSQAPRARLLSSPSRSAAPIP